MKTPKVVSRREPPQTSAEFHALEASLDRELSVVRPFARKRGFVVKARTWEDLAEWESRRALPSVPCLSNKRRSATVPYLDLQMLIRSKSTQREHDNVDI